MAQDRLDPQEYRDLRFFGAITASVSHELNNIITIIDQVGGLLQDILAGAQAGATLRTEQLRTIQERISRQTQRGVAIIKNLNRFAHSVDEQITQFELNGVVGNLVDLARRLVDLKKAHLTVKYAEEEIYVVSSPFRMQQIVFQCLQRFLEDCDPGGEIGITIAHEGELASIVVSGPGGPLNEGSLLGPGALRQMTEAAAVNIATESGPDRARVRIEVPARPGTKGGLP